MSSRMYDCNGYLDIEYLDNRGLPFNIVTGGRGIGKTYGLLKYYMLRKKTIIYMRRTDTQCKVAQNPLFTPYKSVCEDQGIEFAIPKSGSGVKAIYFADELVGKPFAYFMALSTFANVRGFDASDCDAIIYDEFIPEKRERPLKDEGEALLNAYETVNRNRELKGGPPVKLWMLSNSNDIASPIFAELGVLRKILRMSKNQTEEDIDRERGLQIILCYHSPISSAKANTALYKLVKTDYSEMAIGNSFRFDDYLIKSQNLKEYKPLVCIGEITIYEHKYECLYYATTHKSGSPPEYGTSEQEINRFSRRFGYLFSAYATGAMIAESMEVYYIIENFFHRY